MLYGWLAELRGKARSRASVPALSGPERCADAGTDSGLTNVARKDLALWVGGTAYPLSGATESSGGRSYTWTTNIPTFTSGSNYTLRMTAENSAPPMLSSATLVLEFDENLDQNATALPLAAAFSVNSGTFTVARVLTGSSNDKLNLTVTPPITQGLAGTLAYTDPTTGDDASALHDGAGNETPSFTTGSDGVPAVTDTVAVSIRVSDELEPPEAPSRPAVVPVAGSATSLVATGSVPPGPDRPPVTSYDVQYRKSGEPAWRNGPQNQPAARAEIAGAGAEPGTAVPAVGFHGVGDGIAFCGGTAACEHCVASGSGEAG